MNRIDKLEKAAVDLSWKGSHPPEDHPKIEQAYTEARLKLIDYVLEHVLGA
jgi:hypothetical protein